MWHEVLKQAGIAIHVVSTGGGAGLQQTLWEIPGSSAYLSGASFPYDQSEQEQLLGFMPEKFCSEDAAIDLASAAYMKAYKFGGKKAVGLGITASVASEVEHRGDHRVFACLITEDKVLTSSYILTKGVGRMQRYTDGFICDDMGFLMLLHTMGVKEDKYPAYTEYVDATEKARARFFERPFFAANGKRFKDIPSGGGYALMSGSFNPPHEGHFGMAENFRLRYGNKVVFEVGTNPPHKAAPSIQELLQRAKMLVGHDSLFTKDMPLYVDKSTAYPNMPLLIGADALIRMFDPKWGVDRETIIATIQKNRTAFLVTGRNIDGEFVSGFNAILRCGLNTVVGEGPSDRFFQTFQALEGRWDISSTELRAKL